MPNDLASTLASLLVHEKGAGFKPDIFDRLVAAYMDSDGSVWMDVERVLKSSGPGIWDNYRKRIKQRAHDLASIRTIGQENDSSTIRGRWRDAPVSEHAEPPPGWGIAGKDAAVYRIDRRQRDGVYVTNEVLVSYDPIVITKHIQHKETGTVLLEVQWKKGTEWKHHVAERSVLLSSRKIVDCAEFDMPVSSFNAAEMVHYLQAYEHHNLHSLANGYAQSTMGWLGDEEDLGHHGFLCGKTQIGGNGQKIELLGDCSGEIGSRGTFEAWMETIRKACYWPAVRIALAASFAAPLIGIVGAPNCVIENQGDTTGGKTSVLRKARSPWCSPKAKIPTWNTTISGIETRVQSLNDLPFFVDDTAEVPESKRRDLLGSAIYMLESGHTRTRATKDLQQRPAKSWRTIVLSTGEYSLADYVGTGGAAARVLSFWGSPYGEASEQTGAEVSRILTDLGKNYGHAGPMFVKWLCDNRERWDEFEKTYQDLVSQVRKRFSSNAAMRLSETIALLEITTQLVAEAIGLHCIGSILDEDKIEQAVRLAVSRSSAMANKPKQAWQHVLSIASSRNDQWIKWDQSPKAVDPIGGWLGWKLDRGEGLVAAKTAQAPGDDGLSDLLAWHPSHLRRILEEARYPVEATLLSWRTNGILLARDDRTTCVLRCSGTGTTPHRVVVIKRNKTKWDDAVDEIEVT